MNEPSQTPEPTAIVLPSGYRFAGIVSGLRSEPNRRDLAVVQSMRPASAAGVFTQNQVCAAPVQITRAVLPGRAVRGIVVCSGNANACTGEQGLADARRMAKLTAAGLQCEAEEVLVASTGVIGRPLPMAILEAGIPLAIQALAETPESFEDAAHAILTTDTRIKTCCYNHDSYRIAGFAKGAAMIGPNMATMLGFVLTDAAVDPADLHAILRRAADATFNCISVEGHMSTNDTVLLLANGEGPPLAGDALIAFDELVMKTCSNLARQIAADAEGADHLITIHVRGTRSDIEARTIAKTVAESALVKTAIFGADPNWGRIVSAAGYAGVAFAETELSLHVGEFLLYDRGQPLPFNADEVSSYLKSNRQVTLTLDFTLGSGNCTFFTSDLTYEYVKLNADYTT